MVDNDTYFIDGIKGYVENRWYGYVQDMETEVIPIGNMSYEVNICIPIKCNSEHVDDIVISMEFRDIVDVTEDYPEEDDDYYSVIIIVNSCTFPKLSTIDTSDIYHFSEQTERVYNLMCNIYHDLPARETDRTEFYVSNY